MNKQTPVASLPYLVQNNIEAILFDLDDTLLATHAVFEGKIQEVSNYLEKVLQQNSKLIFEELMSGIGKAYQKYVVNPDKIWNHTLKYMAGKYAQQWKNSYTLDCLDIFQSIYQQLPKIIPGVLDLLDLLQQTKVPLGLVTHATPEWTDFKLQGTKLARYFQLLEFFDVNLPKDPSCWENAIKKLNQHPAQILVIGDNIKGDIISAAQIGVKHLIWIDRQEGWQVYRQGELPPGTVTVKSISEIIAILIS